MRIDIAPNTSMEDRTFGLPSLKRSNDHIPKHQTFAQAGRLSRFGHSRAHHSARPDVLRGVGELQNSLSRSRIARPVGMCGINVELPYSFDALRRQNRPGQYLEQGGVRLQGNPIHTICFKVVSSYNTERNARDV